MKRKLTLVMCLFFGICSVSFAGTRSNEIQEGRYVLVMMSGRARENTRVPALVLDSYQGIVWTCQNLQDERPLWVKTDLGQNGNVEVGKKKYVAKMMEWQDADLRMPAVVMDVDAGITWTCPNIIDGKAIWIQKNLLTSKEDAIKMGNK